MIHSPNHELLLDQIATTCKQRGLQATALSLLEVGQPLMFIGSQLLWLAQPALALFWPASRVSQVAQLLEDPAAMRSLMARLAPDEKQL